MKATMKKVLAMLLVVTTVAAIAVGGTLAYLTVDAGEEHNVFSVGNIDVSLDEDVGIYGEGGEVKENEDGAEYIEVMPGDYLKKEVTVTNNGKTDAYVAVTVTLNNATAINAAIDEVYGDGEASQVVYNYVFNGWGINQNPRPGVNGNDARGVIDGTYGLPDHVLNVDFTKKFSDYWLYSAGNWFYGEGEKAGTYDAGYGSTGGYYAKDMNADEIRYTYYLYLPAGESSTLFNGLNVPAEFDADQLAMFDDLKIDIEASAIQADNITVADEYTDDAVYGKAKTAFAILAGDIEGEGISTTIETVEGNVELNDGEVVVVSGDQNAFTVSGKGTLVLKDAVVTAIDGQSALTITTGSNVNVIVSGNTALTGAAGGDGIEVEADATLNLSGTGTLTAKGNGGSEDVSSSNGGNGIGGAGTINIAGLSNLTAEGYGKHAAGIGGESSSITISGTTITNVRGGFAGEEGTDTTYYKDAPEGAPAIGSSTNGAVVTLNNVKIVKAEGGSKAAGIGGSYWTTITVNIDGSTIDNVVGGVTAAGIGGSRIMNDGHNTTTININDSTINAKGGTYGAGIGSGYDTYCHSYGAAPICTINITGNSVITAKGGKYAAGVGTGYHAGGLAGEIAESVTVNATSGEKTYKDTYTSAMNVGFGVLDPARDGLNNTCTITYEGEEIGVPSV